jgi:prolyl-tRNA editing enzyme YbaK/EbsC (Cys-tRNA(Pro) deacylase)
VLARGPNRAGERRIAELLGEPIEKADAAFVRETSGFAIGRVPPVGHTITPVAFVDEDLLAEDEVWASAGHTHVVFGLDPAELPRITEGRVVRVTDG